MSTSVFAKPTESSVLRIRTSAKTQILSKTRIFNKFNLLLFSLFILQQVWIEAIFKNTEIAGYNDMKLLYRLEVLQNDNSNGGVKLTKLEERWSSMTNWGFGKNASAPAVSGGSSFRYPTGPAYCGGYALLEPGVTNLSYGVPPDGSTHWCVWAVRSRMEGKISITRTELSEEFGWNYNKVSLGVGFNPSSADCKYFNLLATRTFKFDGPIVFIFFYGPLGSGFRLELQGDGSRSESLYTMSFVRQTSSFTYKFPPGSGSYPSHQLFALVATPQPGQAIRVAVNDIRVEPRYDWVSVMWMSAGNYFNCLTESESDKGSMSASGDMDSPVLVYFSSDEGLTYEGFRVTGEPYQ